jgi:dCMP deaminase
MSKYLEGITRDMIESQGYLYDDMSPMIIDMEVINNSDKNATRMIIKDKSGKEKSIDGEDNITNFIDEIKSRYKQQKYDKTYLNMALEWAKLSHCTRKQVGALIVKNGMIISDGYNGTPTGFENSCETEENETHWFVIHGEANAILKCAKHGQSCQGSTLYLTHSPCKDCSKLILQSGISKLVYMEDYKDLSGLEFLKNAGLEIVKY